MRHLRRVAVVVPQQAAQPFAALHGPASACNFTAGVDEPVLQSLVIPLGVLAGGRIHSCSEQLRGCEDGRDFRVETTDPVLASIQARGMQFEHGGFKQVPALRKRYEHIVQTYKTAEAAQEAVFCYCDEYHAKLQSYREALSLGDEAAADFHEGAARAWWLVAAISTYCSWLVAKSEDSAGTRKQN